MRLYFGYIEAWNPNLHGGKESWHKYLQTKYLSFHYKQQEESLHSYLQEYPESNKLIQIYKFKDYSFGKDRVDLIIKIQSLWREYQKRKIAKHFSIKKLYYRQTGMKRH